MAKTTIMNYGNVNDRHIGYTYEREVIHGYDVIKQTLEWQHFYIESEEDYNKRLEERKAKGGRGGYPKRKEFADYVVIKERVCGSAIVLGECACKGTIINTHLNKALNRGWSF